MKLQYLIYCEKCKVVEENHDCNSMKYYYIIVTTQYDGYEWLSRAIAIAPDKEYAIDKATKTDFTHQNDIEVQYEPDVKEISKADYEILKEYLYII